MRKETGNEMYHRSTDQNQTCISTRLLANVVGSTLATFPTGRRYRVFDVLQGGRERIDELVGQLGQEADGVHVEHGHVTGQLAGVHRHVQRSEQLVPGLEGAVPGQCFDQSGLSCPREEEYSMSANGGTDVCYFICWQL